MTTPPFIEREIHNLLHTRWSHHLRMNPDICANWKDRKSFRETSCLFTSLAPIEKNALKWTPSSASLLGVVIITCEIESGESVGLIGWLPLPRGIMPSNRQKSLSEYSQQKDYFLLWMSHVMYLRAVSALIYFCGIPRGGLTDEKGSFTQKFALCTFWVTILAYVEWKKLFTLLVIFSSMYLMYRLWCERLIWICLIFDTNWISQQRFTAS